MNRGLRPTPAYFFSSPFNRRACKRNRIADRWNNVGWMIREVLLGEMKFLVSELNPGVSPFRSGS